MDADITDTIARQLVYLPRIFVAMSLLSVLGKSNIPKSVMNGITIALIMVLAPPTAAELAVLNKGMVVVLFTVKEGMIGFLIAYMFSLIFAAAETAGQFIDHQSGLTFSQNIDPVNGNQTSPTATFLVQLCYMVFWATGGMLIFITTIYDSFLWWPITDLQPALFSKVTDLTGAYISNWFAGALMASAAILFTLAFIDFAFGMLGRAAPNMQLNQLTSTFKGLIVILILALSVTSFADSFRYAMLHAVKVLKSLGPMAASLPL